MESSSDSDVEFSEAPSDVRPVRGRRKAHTPSPSLIARKKQREILANVEGNDTAMEGETSREPGGKGAAAQKPKRKRPVETTSSDSSEEEGSPSRDVENNPPQERAPPVDDIPEECSQPQNNGETAPRSRKRLSIRSDASGSGLNRSSTSNVESVVASASEVQTIYDTCSQMFNANKINPQNAFNMRLLDCINQMINSPGYDKTNMQLTSTTVEIGTKIYVCRVDNTHSQVMSLAGDIALQQRRQAKKGGEAGVNQGGDDGEHHDGENPVDDEEEEGQRRQRQRKKQIRKRGRFVEEDNSKLTTDFADQDVKFVTRRNHLKKKFNEMIYEGTEFDYLSYCLDPEESHPLLAEEEKEKLNTPFKIPENCFISEADMGRVDFLPFRHVQEFDPEVVDIWGRPLNEAEELRDAAMTHNPELPVHDEFAYDPNERPAQYPDEGGLEMNDTFGNGGFGDDIEGEGLAPVSFRDIRTLDQLDEHYQKMRKLLNSGKSKFGWIGPNFARAKNTWPTQRQNKKPRQKKEPERIDFMAIDWNAKGNKYSTGHAARTVFDERVIESWSKNKTVVPFLGIEISSNEDQEDFDILDFQNEADPKFIPQIFKLFTSRNRSILDLISSGTSDRQRNLSGGMNDDGFDHDNDIELPRDIAEDFCSQPADEGMHHQDEGPTPTEPWQGPGSDIPGLLSDDPLSLVSGIDSIRFSKKPKPIDMSQLKKAIIKSLSNSLKLEDGTGLPLTNEETHVDFADLMLDVITKLDARTEKLLSVPIFMVALMHVVADKRLFVLVNPQDPVSRWIICRGKDFDHRKFIPGLGSEF